MHRFHVAPAWKLATVALFTAVMASAAAQESCASVDHSAEVALDAHGNLTVASSVAGEDACDVDVLVSKHDASGQSVWTQRLSSVKHDSAHGLVVGDDGSTYVAGQTAGAIARNASPSGGAYVAKLGPDGDVTWIVQFGSSSHVATAVVVDDDGNAYVAGNAGQSQPDTYTAHLAKFDEAGDLQWLKTIRLDDSQTAMAVVLLPTGEVMVSGHAWPTSGRAGGGLTPYVAVFDALGNEREVVRTAAP